MENAVFFLTLPRLKMSFFFSVVTRHVYVSYLIIRNYRNYLFFRYRAKNYLAPYIWGRISYFLSLKHLNRSCVFLPNRTSQYPYFPPYFITRDILTALTYSSDWQQKITYNVRPMSYICQWCDWQLVFDSSFMHAACQPNMI